jgi:hypothetical protein
LDESPALPGFFIAAHPKARTSRAQIANGRRKSPSEMKPKPEQPLVLESDGYLSGSHRKSGALATAYVASRAEDFDSRPLMTNLLSDRTRQRAFRVGRCKPVTTFDSTR